MIRIAQQISALADLRQSCVGKRRRRFPRRLSLRPLRQLHGNVVVRLWNGIFDGRDGVHAARAPVRVRVLAMTQVYVTRTLNPLHAQQLHKLLISLENTNILTFQQVSHILVMPRVRHLARWGYGLTRRLTLWNWSGPPLLRKSCYTEAVDFACRAFTDCRNNLRVPTLIIGLKPSSNCSRNHITKLYANAQM